MSDGWILIHRSLKKKAWTKDPDCLALWVHLLMSAAWEDKQVMMNGEIIELKRGQLIAGRKALSEKTGIDPNKIYRTTKRFESEQQINIKTTNKYSIISITNYDQYQSPEQKNEQQVNSKTTQRNNINNINNTSRRTKFSEEDMVCAKWIWQKIQELQPNRKPPKFETWANAVRLMVERDNRTHHQICELFQWANNNSFWQTNILSPGKLREKWDDLTLRRSNEKTNRVHKPRFQGSALQRFEQSLAANLDEGLESGHADV